MLLEADRLLAAQEDHAVGIERGAQVFGVGCAKRLGEIEPGYFRADGGLAAMGLEAAGQGVALRGCHGFWPFMVFP